MSTDIHQSRGNVHTGSGDQWNLAFQVVEQIKAATRRGSGAWSETAFEDVRARFYPPDGFDRLQTGMEELKILVLKGKPGSGRRFAALKLLSKSEHGPGLFYAPGIDDDDSLGKLTPETGDRFLIDLSTMSPGAFNLVTSDVQPFFKRVLDAGARSVLILPDDCEPAAEWQKYVRKVVQADPVRAFAKHLRSVDIGAEGIDEAGIRDHFRHAPMRDLDRLRELVDDARIANPTLDHRAWTNAALEALRAGPVEVAAILRGLKVGHQRALLLSASLFAGRSADGAWHATRVLLDTLKYPKDPDLPLDQSDLQEQLALFGAGIDQNGRLQFQKPLDAAIRSYLWDGYPALRLALAEWMEALITGWRWSPTDVTRVVERFGEQHLRTKQIESVLKLIARLADSGGANSSAQAFLLLKQGLEHPQHGRRFRMQVLDWATKTPTVGLGEVLVQACTEVIVETYPEQALVRLHHLARSPGPVGDSARSELVTLFGRRRLHRLIRRLLFRMTEFPNQRDPYVFVHVIDPFVLTDTEGRPRPLVAEAAVRSDLVLAWRATLHARPDGWQPSLDRWLGAVTDVPRRRDALLSILAAAPDDLEARSLLHSAALEWAAAHGGAWKTVDDLLNRINLAQGISFVSMERTDR